MSQLDSTDEKIMELGLWKHRRFLLRFDLYWGKALYRRPPFNEKDFAHLQAEATAALNQLVEDGDKTAFLARLQEIESRRPAVGTFYVRDAYQLELCDRWLTRRGTAYKSCIESTLELGNQLKQFRPAKGEPRLAIQYGYRISSDNVCRPVVRYGLYQPVKALLNIARLDEIKLFELWSVETIARLHSVLLELV